jgi:hypothetical protein
VLLVNLGEPEHHMQAMRRPDSCTWGVNPEYSLGYLKAVSISRPNTNVDPRLLKTRILGWEIPTQI